MQAITAWTLAALLCSLSTATAAVADALSLEAIVPLGDVSGRIDHLAADLGRKRLYIAELGNDSIGIVDLASHPSVETLTGFDEPQGIGYDAATDTVYVANGGDGSLLGVAGDSYERRTRVELGNDADNVRVDATSQTILVGFGTSLALVDARSHAVRSIELGGHPESFQLDAESGRVFANVPSRRAVAVIDLADERVAWFPTRAPGANYPMARDASGVLLLPLRHPAQLLELDIDHPRGGTRTTDVCDDADDIFLDVRRKRAYVSCGDGHIDVFERTPAGLARTSQIDTARGARTSLFVPQWDRLFVAVPASAESAAAVWIMAPQ